jgi:hypothetical protein
MDEQELRPPERVVTAALVDDRALLGRLALYQVSS